MNRLSIEKGLAKLRRRFGKQSFARNVAVLMTGTVGAHLITVAVVPITTRLYSPAEFSILTIYSSLLSILLTLATLSLHIGIPIATTHRRALSLVVVSGLVLLAWVVLITFMAWVGNDLILALLQRPDFGPYLYLLIPGFLLGGTYAIMQMWFSRQKQFSLIAQTRVMRSIGGSCAQVGFGFIGFGPLGLVLGHMLYSGLGAIGLTRKFALKERAKLHDLRREDLAGGLLRHRGYVYFTTPENLANVLAIHLPLISIAANPAAGEVGHFYMAQMIMMLPMMVIGSSVGQVFIVEAPTHYRNGTLFPFVLRVMRSLALTGVPVLLTFGLLAPLLSKPILGAEWERTGNLVAWITPWVILQLLSSPLSTIFYVAGRQFLAMAIQIGGLILRYGAVLAALSLAPEVTMEAYAVSGAVVYGSVLLTILLVARKLT